MHLLDNASPHGSTVLSLEATYNLMMQAWQREMIIQVQLYSENLGFSLGGSQEWVDNGCCEFNGSYGGFHIEEQPKLCILIS